MDKKVYNVKAEKIQTFVKQGEYEQALEICDTIDWTQIKSARMLALVSSVYENVGQYDMAIDVLLMAYEEATAGRRLLYKLTELAIAAGSTEEAEDYYKNYLEEAGSDTSRFVLRYKLAVLKGEPLDKKIEILEAFKEEEFDEEWSYKLAELYDNAGRSDACMKLCDEIVTWFGVGEFVEKAKALKNKYLAASDDTEILPEIMLTNITGVGQPVAGIDTEAIADADIDIDLSSNDLSDGDADLISATRKINDKEDFSMTRIYNKLAKEETAAAQTDAADETNASGETDAADKTDAIEEETSYESIPHVIYVSSRDPKEAVANAVSTIKKAHKAEGTEQNKIIKILATKLNNKGVVKYIRALEGRDLIILGAHVLTDKLLREIKIVNEKIDSEKFFVFADSRGGLVNVKKRYDAIDIVVESEEEVEAEPVAEVEEVEPAAEVEEAEPIAEVEEAEPIAEVEEADTPEIAIQPVQVELELETAPEVEIEEEAEETQEELELETEPEVEIEDEAEEAQEELELETEIEEPEEETDEELEEESNEEVEEDFESPADDDIEDDLDDESEVEEDGIPEIAIQPMQVEAETEEDPEIEEEPEPVAEPAPAAEPEPVAEPEELESAEEEEPEPAEERAPAANILTKPQFFEYMKAYIKRIDCVLEEEAEDAIIKYIEQLDKEGDKLTKTLAIEVVESAADDAEKATSLFHSKYDKKGNLILKAKHFI